MKKFILEFCRRGFFACGFGPMVLAVLYLMLQRCGVVDTLSIQQVCTGIFSLSALAFIAGGMNAIYQFERLPLMTAILIHACVLYASYLVTYLLNSWLEWGVTPILVFSGIFVFGFVAIWGIIYLVIRQNTDKLNKQLQQQQQKSKDN